MQPTEIMEMTETKISIALIRKDAGAQPRDGLNAATVDEYAFQMKKRKAKFPPIRVVYDGEAYHPFDGYHRLAAYEKLKRTDIPALVMQGTREDAVWYSCQANVEHGLQRTVQDKQRAVRTALRHPRGLGLADKDLAEHCGVDVKTVSTWRQKLIEDGDLAKSGNGTAPASDDEEGADTEDEPIGDPGPGVGNVPGVGDVPGVGAHQQTFQTDPQAPTPDPQQDGLAALPASTDAQADDQAPTVAVAEAAEEPVAAPQAPPLPAALVEAGWQLVPIDGQWYGTHPDLHVETQRYDTAEEAMAQVQAIQEALDTTSAADGTETAGEMAMPVGDGVETDGAALAETEAVHAPTPARDESDVAPDAGMVGADADAGAAPVQERPAQPTMAIQVAFYTLHGTWTPRQEQVWLPLHIPPGQVDALVQRLAQGAVHQQLERLVQEQTQ